MKIRNMIIGMALGGLALSSAGLPTDFKASASVPELSVYGEATIEVAPDYAKIYGVIENVSLDGNETSESVLSAYSKLQESIVGLGLEKDSVNSVYLYEGGCNFDGQIILKTSLDFYVQTENMDNLTEVVSLISNSEHTRVKSINYELASDSAYKEALSKATQNALDKANSLTNTDGMVVCEIQEECYYYSNSSYKDFISIEDGLTENIKVKARVKVTMCYEESDVVEEENTNDQDTITQDDNIVEEEESKEESAIEEKEEEKTEETNEKVTTIKKKASEEK